MGAVRPGEPSWWEGLRDDQVARLRRDRENVLRRLRPGDLSRNMAK